MGQAIRAGKDAAPVTRSGVDVLDRAFLILFSFRADDAPLTLAELASRTGLYKSTLLRLANSLISHRFLVKLEDGRYRLGSAPFTLGSIYQSSLNLGDVLLPLMRELNAELGEAVAFHVREGDHRVCLYRLKSRFTVRTEVRQGDVQALDRGAGGRVLLAFSDTPGAPYDAIRRDYSYISCGERDAETAGISAPVFGVRQSLVGALGVAGPSNRLGRSEMEKLRPRLLAIAARASEMLGGNPDGLSAAAHAAGAPSAPRSTTMTSASGSAQCE